MRKRRHQRCRTSVLRSLVPLLGLVAAKEGRLSSSPAANAFVDGLAKGEAGVIIEVGANTGAYSDQLMRRCQKAGLKVASLTLVDPQASMRPRLQRLAEEWKGEFVSAAATADEGNITFFTSRNSHVSSTLSSAASRYGLKSATVVPTVDLSALIFRTIERAKATHHGTRLSVLLKLDVEGAEYDLLPHLLVKGALCLVDFLVIDWHLNSLPEARRLAGIGLRHSLGATVRGACTGRSLQIEHEEFRPINFGMPVPGLLSETVRHTHEGETRGELPHLGIKFTLSVDKKSRSLMKALKLPMELVAYETDRSDGE